MLKKLSVLMLMIVMTTSCVSKKIYGDFEDKYAIVKKQNRALVDTNIELTSAKSTLETNLAALQKQYDKTLAKRNQLQIDYDSTKTRLDSLKFSYKALKEVSATIISENAAQTRELIAKVEAKEQALAIENDRLEALKNESGGRFQRLLALENLISLKETEMTNLKNTLFKALIDYKDDGVAIVQHDGKVHVTIQNTMLFKSGSWEVEVEGKRAIQQLADALGRYPETAILIEGHTDNLPIKDKTQVNNNWELSLKYASAIVELLMQNSAIHPENLSMAGRGEFEPIASNDTEEGKAENRRIEFILTPNMDEVTKMLSEI